MYDGNAPSHAGSVRLTRRLFLRDGFGPLHEALKLQGERRFVAAHRAFKERRQVTHHAGFPAAGLPFGQPDEVDHQRCRQQPRRE